MLRGSLTQVSSREEQCGSVLSAHKDVGRSQPADSLGNRAAPWCLSFPPPLHLQVLSISGQELFPGGHKQPMGPMSNVACLGFLEQGGLGWLHTLLYAWQRVRLSSVPKKQRSLQALGILFSSCRLVPGDLPSLAAEL